MVQIIFEITENRQNICHFRAP